MRLFGLRWYYSHPCLKTRCTNSVPTHGRQDKAPTLAAGSDDLGRPCFNAADASLDVASGLEARARCTAEAADPFDLSDSPTCAKISGRDEKYLLMIRFFESPDHNHTY
jgi:hypothetical protein